jgi:excisionase family DNA binding protein
MSYTPSQLAKILNVSKETLRLWNENGTLQATKTKGGHRRYFYQSSTELENGTKTNYIYARVSSQKQSNDLERQIALLQKAYPSYEVVKDTASGINFRRPGMLKILEEVFRGNVSEVVVAHRDRLTRFGFELFQFIFSNFNVKLTILQDQIIKEPLGEFATDLLSIITVYTARYYGMRKYNIHKKNKVLSKPRTKSTLQQMPRRFKVLLQQNSRLHK